MTAILARPGFALARLAIELVYYASLPVVYPILLVKRYTASIRPAYPDLDGGIMVHAASLGEVNAVRSLLAELSARLPDTAIFVSTTSLTGMRAAEKIGGNVSAALSVLDVPHLRRRQLKELNPGLICVVETEIWPNLLYEAARRGIPVLFLNARMSAGTLNRLLPLRGMLKIAGVAVKEIFASTQADAERFKQLFNAKVTVAGNLKAALRLPDYDPADLRGQWGFCQDDFIVCAGSTRPGEEKLLADILAPLQAGIPRLKLIVGVRHPQRSKEVKNLFNDANSRMFSEAEPAADAANVLILDVLGQMDKAYAMSDIALVGGSFYDFGGHNPLEPAYYGKPVIMGPYHSSCAASVKNMLDADAIIITGRDSLEDTIAALYRDPSRRHEMGANGKEMLKRLGQALDVHLDGILRWMQ